ncbi:MAG: hypothetical protein NXI31_12125 [bacterium]|nr:hypothetical protein [bacterium]
MDYELAKEWLDLIAIGVAVAWFLGGVFVFLTAQVLNERSSGEIVVDTTAPEFLQGAQSLLAKGIASSPLSRIALVESTADSLVWKGGFARLRHSGSLRVVPSGNRARVAWQLEHSSSMITAAIWVVALGAIAAMTLYWLLSEHALPSDKPHVRGQVFQMFQACHLLWPPLLFAGIARGARSQLVQDLERGLGNLGVTAAGAD